MWFVLQVAFNAFDFKLNFIQEGKSTKYFDRQTIRILGLPINMKKRDQSWEKEVYLYRSILQYVMRYSMSHFRWILLEMKISKWHSQEFLLFHASFHKHLCDSSEGKDTVALKQLWQENRRRKPWQKFTEMNFYIYI